MVAMAKPLVSDGLWERIEPLLPAVQRRYRYPGRKRVPDRAALTGVLFVLKTGIPWEHLPQEMGCGSGMTCWRRLRDWNEAGVWERLHQVLLDELQDAQQLDWSRVAVDSSHVRAKRGGAKTGPSPVDRRRAGSKHHVICEGQGIPLAVTLTAANRNDISELIALVDRVPPTGRYGKFRPKTLLATVPMTAESTVKHCESAASHRGSPNAAPATAPASAKNAGYRAHNLVASCQPAPRSPLRPPSRHPRSLPHHRLRPHLPQTPTTIHSVRRS